jgi:hypothetical protein
MVLMAHLEYELLIVVFFFVCQNDKFNKEPTDTEIEFGKFHGIPAFIEYVHEQWKPRGSIRGGGEEASNSSGSDERTKAGKKVVTLALRENKDKCVVNEVSKGSTDTSSSDASGSDESTQKSDVGASRDGENGSDGENKSNGEEEDR